MSTIIRIENLSKKYKLGELYSNLLSETIGNSVRAFFGKVRGGNSPNPAPLQQPSLNEIWALKDVNLTVQAGEVVGFIGRNGAGKSTLLKILSRITEPTTGVVTLNGRVSSLLEVGTGFHSELTGRENIFLNGAILGMSKMEIRRKFDEIVTFSEIGKFIDTPVKRYSSGMYVRLAFAVAAHLEPEILIVDEVLAVGDYAFQKKCLGKMQDVSRGGRTVLFVSHNMTAIKDLCHRAVWLDSGRVLKDGEKNEIVTEYLHTDAKSILEQRWEDPKNAPGNDKVRLHLARLSTQGESRFLTVRTPLDVEFEFWNFVPEAELRFSLHLYNLAGTCVFNSNSASRTYPVGHVRGVCHIPGDFLNDGTYRIMIMIDQDKSYGLYKHEDILVFDVQDIEREGHWHGKWPGEIRPKLDWKLEYLGNDKGCSLF